MISSSKLGEPLNAEIELLAVTPNELNSIQAALASEQVYQDQMLEKPASYPFIKIEVGNNTKGQPVLKLSSTQPITEAFLDMLIQVDWPTGRLVKEYTLLLDPPGFNSNYVSESAGLPITSQQAPTPSSIQPVTKPATETAPSEPAAIEPKKSAKSVKPKAIPKETPETTETPSDSVTTERGDTLYAIARQMKPDNISTEQMLAALYQSNQQAFDGKNMNRLKVGKIIRMPDQATLDSISRAQARSLVAEHTTNWLAYKNTLAKVVKESEPSNMGGNAQQSAGKIGSAADKPASQANAGKDVLKLSAGDEKSTSQADKAASKATAAQEEAIAKENAIKEEQSRAAALEKQVADMKKLMEMKNNAMAQAEKNAAQATESQTGVKTEPATQEKPAEQAQTTPAPEAQDKLAAEQQPAQAEPPVTAPFAEEAGQPPSFMHVLLERLKNISPVLPWALIALPILLCVWALIRIRRKKQIDTFEDVIVTSPATEMQNNTVFGDTQAAASGDTSFLTDFSQSGVGGMIDSHDVDPIAEAEVYMAYGRDAQAEEILKDAIQKDPEREELKLKLLEIYQATGNKVAFESLASEVYAKVGPADATWSKVTAMGQKVDPENPLYGTSAEDASAQLVQPAVIAADEAQAEEEGYNFNFEAPALEFDEASQAVAAASASEEQVSDERKESVTAQNETNEVPGLQPETETTNAFQVEPSIDFADTRPDEAQRELASSAAEVAAEPEAEEPLRFEVEPSVQTALNDDVSMDADAALTPKSLDLPSLNLEDDISVAETGTNKPLQMGSGEQALSTEDAVFESLPELSLELGGPNDTTKQASDDDVLDIDEINLTSPVESLNEVATPATTSDEVAFPEISLDVADTTATSLDTPEDEPEEVNTKLDLIQAYIDMEDAIGAKELIEEVLAEGGERQRQRANELLSKIA
ncbi:FimV/HubP family polar landmark protein [Methylophilus sp.]|uniref:FimV/HubP family polar landmark protein n=1 Tax=Methylophilus sp. TaxID=29541 RepID=UPI002580CA6C|nr:FimV/HubP family polar landmark protein [Methylophilus sp.]